MQEQLISFETAELAKEKGFDFKVYKEEKIYDKLGYLLKPEDEVFPNVEHFPAPTQSLLQKWLREVHNINVFINRDGMFRKESYCIFIHDNIKDISRLRPLDNDVFSGYSTYEEALEVGLQEALKLINKL